MRGVYQIMSENKKKIAYWMTPTMIAEIQSFVDEGYSSSKGEFVREAVEFYMGYLRSEKNMDYLAPLIATAVRKEIESSEKNISEMLFKLAVESAKQNHVIAYAFNVDEENLDGLNNACCGIVARNNGVVLFEDAYEIQSQGKG